MKLKLKIDFTITEVGHDILAMPSEDNDIFQGMLRVNESGAAILELLTEELTAEEIRQRLHQRYPGSDMDQISVYLSKFLEQLFREGLLQAAE